jgi:hypothetical protein
MDARGHRGFSGAATQPGAARRKARMALILLGDWCAAAQPQLENQVREELLVRCWTKKKTSN